MVVGDYTFVLKVTDTGGQTASSSLTVVVQPEKNAPPVAVAGSDKVCLVSLCSRFCFVVIFCLVADITTILLQSSLFFVGHTKFRGISVSELR